MSKKVIRIAAALIDDGNGRLLLVRKRGTAAFMQPGGKIEPGEAPFAALRRELQEEIGFPAGGAVHLGCFSAPAAHEPGCTVDAELFHLRSAQDATPRGEIAEAVWVPLRCAERLALAPLTRDHVLPLARALSNETRR